jgi:hypothetical protein
MKHQLRQDPEKGLTDYTFTSLGDILKPRGKTATVSMEVDWPEPRLESPKTLQRLKPSGRNCQ